jgi:hypothetical protein
VRTVLYAAVGAILGFVLVGLVGSIVALATPVRATPLTVVGLAVAALFAWLGALRARRPAARP